MSFDDEILDAIPKLRRYALRLARNSSDAEDLMHDTLESAYQMRKSYTQGTNIVAWLFTIQRHIFLNGARKIRRRAQSELVAADRALAAVQQGDQEANLLWRDIVAEFDRLNPDAVETFGLVALDGLTYQEAAEALDISIGTVRSRIARVRMALRRVVAERATADD